MNPHYYWPAHPVSHWSVARLAKGPAALGGFVDEYQDTLKIRQDPYGNALVLPEYPNGVLGGELILAHRRSKHSTGQKLTYDFLDLDSAQWSVLIRARSLTLERHALGSDVAILRFVHQELAGRVAAERRPELCLALARIALTHEHVHNPHKVRLMELVTKAAEELDSLGRWNPSAKRARLVPAIDEGELRLDDLNGIEIANTGRSRLVAHEVQFQNWAVDQIQEVLAGAEGPIGDGKYFLPSARLVNFKPERLSINNGWYHRNEEGSCQDTQDGLSIFCPLYGPLQRPMRIIGRQSLEDIAENSEAITAMLDDQAAILDLVRLGGDHGVLMREFGELAAATRQALASGAAAEVKQLASVARHWLRYRIMPGETEAPLRWYCSLPAA